MNTKEIFKDIPNYEGVYQVSNLGNVKSLSRFNSRKERILSNYQSKNGYHVVNLSIAGKYKTNYIHQLMAIAFLNHTPNGYKLVVDHIDNDKTNNNLNNLQLVTQRYNCSKDKKSKYIGVEYRKKSNTYTARIRVNGKLRHISTHKTAYQAHLAYQKELSHLYKL